MRVFCHFDTFVIEIIKSYLFERRMEISRVAIWVKQTPKLVDEKTKGGGGGVHPTREA